MKRWWTGEYTLDTQMNATRPDWRNYVKLRPIRHLTKDLRNTAQWLAGESLNAKLARAREWLRRPKC